jgi:hypothetical protein
MTATRTIERLREDNERLRAALIQAEADLILAKMRPLPTADQPAVVRCSQCDSTDVYASYECRECAYKWAAADQPSDDGHPPLSGPSFGT